MAPGFQQRLPQLILGGVPLIVYPAVLLASVMSLAGVRTGYEPWLMRIVVPSFLVGSIIYPLVYIVSIGLVVWAEYQGRSLFSLRASVLPLLYLLLLGVLFLAWAWLDRPPPIQREVIEVYPSRVQ